MCDLKDHLLHVVRVGPHLELAHLHKKNPTFYILLKTRLRYAIKNLRVEWKVVEDHWTDECDLRRLRVHDLSLRVHPQTGQLGQNVDHLI